MARTRSKQTMQRLAVAFVLLATVIGAAAQSDDDAARKAARRAQLQMLQLQQQAKDAEAAKAKVEGDKAALDKQLREQSQQVARLKGALPKALESLKASEAARAELAASVAALEKQLADQKLAHEAALGAAERSAKERADQQARLQGRYDATVVQVNACSAKNERLVHLSAELLERYRNKGFSAVLKQRDPVLGLGDVEMFNLVQEYRDKADAERFSSSINR